MDSDGISTKLFFAVCDDIKAIRDDLAIKLHALYGEQIDLHLFSYGEELLSYVKSNCDRNGIVLLDIQLGEDNGIEEAIKMQKLSSQVKVIFMTGYTEYLSDIFEARPKDLLFKPIEQSKLERAIQRTLRSMEDEEREEVVVKIVGGALEQIKPSAIVYLESEKRVIHIHEDGRVLDTYMKLEEMEKMLPDYFVYCHKSYIINLHRIKNYSMERFVLDNGVEIPISRSRRDSVRQKFFAFSREKFHSDNRELGNE